MKENVFDVLIYLFENYMDSDVEEPTPDPDMIRTELLEAGFPHTEVNKAFEWLESLTEQQVIKPVSSPAFRIFSDQEMIRLDAECRGLLLFLEQSGILTPASRELVIDRAMAFNDESISLENLKWIILMVLFSRPDEEIAFARMENLVYESLPTYLH
jgi:Smg protein